MPVDNAISTANLFSINSKLSSTKAAQPSKSSNRIESSKT